LGRLRTVRSGVLGASQLQAPGDHHEDQDHKGASKEKMPS
jgi:hypothetical protein